MMLLQCKAQFMCSPQTPKSSYTQFCALQLDRENIEAFDRGEEV